MATQRESGLLFESESIVLPKTISVGIKVDEAAPTFPWEDLIGDVRPKTAGAGTPALAAFKDNQYGYSFVANDVCDFIYHMPHWYAPGTDLFFHVHHSHNGTAITGDIVWTYYVMYGTRDNPYGTEATGTITYSTVNIATTPQYVQEVTEIQLSTAGGAADKLNTSILEVDGLIKLRLKLTTLPTITGGSLFLDTADIHIQSIGVGTKSKAPNFYT